MVRVHVPVTKVRGFEARRALDIYESPGGYGCGWWQAVARRVSEGTGHARLCEYLKHSDSKFCHKPICITGIARLEGRGQGQRNKLCLAEDLSL